MTGRLPRLRREFLRRRRIDWLRRLRERINQGFPLHIERVVNLGEVPAGPLPTGPRSPGSRGLNILWSSSSRVRSRNIRCRCFWGGRPTGSRDFDAITGLWPRRRWSTGGRATCSSMLKGEPWRHWTVRQPLGINQWYPVIYLRPQDPERRIWPPTYEGAPLTLRVVSMEQAAKRLAGNLQRAWVDQRDLELAAMTTP